MFVSKKCLGITIIVLDNVLEICIELIKLRNDNVVDKFIGSEFFGKVTRRAGVFPMESDFKTIAKRARVEPRTQMHVTMKMLFLENNIMEKCFVNFENSFI